MDCCVINHLQTLFTADDLQTFTDGLLEIPNKPPLLNDQLFVDVDIEKHIK